MESAITRISWSIGIVSFCLTSQELLSVLEEFDTFFSENFEGNVCCTIGIHVAKFSSSCITVCLGNIQLKMTFSSVPAVRGDLMVPTVYPHKT